MNDDMLNRELWSGLGGLPSLVRVTLRDLVLYTRNRNNCLITMVSFFAYAASMKSLPQKTGFTSSAKSI